MSWLGKISNIYKVFLNPDMQNVLCFIFTEREASHTVLISTGPRAIPLLPVLVPVPRPHPHSMNTLYQHFRFYLFYYFMFMFKSVLPTCVYGARGGQKRVFDPLGLEIQVLVSYQVGAEN